MVATLEPGCFLAFPIRKDLFGVCRVGEIDSACMMVEVKDWFGAAAPKLSEVVSADVLHEAPARSLPGPAMRYLVLSGKPPRGGVVVGFDAKAAREPIPYDLGLSWKHLAERTLEAWARSRTRNPKQVLRAEKRAAAERRGLSVAQLRIEQDAKDALRQWREGEYDNYKDAILEARDLIAKTKGELPALAARLQKMHDAAVARLAKLAEEDPDVARYAKGLIPATKKKAKPRKR